MSRLYGKGGACTLRPKKKRKGGWGTRSLCVRLLRSGEVGLSSRAKACAAGFPALPEALQRRGLRRRAQKIGRVLGRAHALCVKARAARGRQDEQPGQSQRSGPTCLPHSTTEQGMYAASVPPPKKKNEGGRK